VSIATRVAPRRRAVPLVALALVLGACISPLRSDRYMPDDGRPGLATKVVARKVEPNYLVAVDQTTCEVSTERFRQVRVGQRAFCNWTGGSPVGPGRGVDPQRPASPLWAP